MYWKQMHSTVRSYVNNCKSCQVNKRCSQKYGKLPTKIVTITPWEAVCVDLIGPYTLHGKDGTEIDFMCLTMIDPASSWFEPVVELSPTSQSKIKAKSHDKTTDAYFDKSLSMISTLVNKTWFSWYPLMTSLHQFEENIILLETLADINRTDTGQNKHKFCIRCFFKHYEWGNNTIRKSHKQFFRDTVNHHYVNGNYEVFD